MQVHEHRVHEVSKSNSEQENTKGIARITATTTEDKQALIESRSKGCTEICIVLKR
ncbi:hypothetical protein HanPI659440_Chr15g0595661 [Helianthus annuus]|nr:hypothetical protein HanPI659440_Chr15g0595661 [Helianthus annuus]